jgi:hypothetical protein
VSGDKRIIDIRYFEYAKLPAAGVNPRISKELGPLLESQRDGQRIARLLRFAGFSIGREDHLYLIFSRAVAPHQIQKVSFVPVPWAVSMVVGLPRKGELRSTKKKSAFVRASTFAVLRELAPTQRDVLARVERELDDCGADVKIPLLQKKAANTEVMVSFDVPTRGRRGRLFIDVFDSGRHSIVASHEVALREFDDALSLAGTIAIKGTKVVVKARNSPTSRTVAARYKSPIIVSWE